MIFGRWRDDDSGVEQGEKSRDDPTKPTLSSATTLLNILRSPNLEKLDGGNAKAAAALERFDVMRNGSGRGSGKGKGGEGERRWRVSRTERIGEARAMIMRRRRGKTVRGGYERFVVRAQLVAFGWRMLNE